MIICMSFTTGSTGGEYKHLLTVDEMPSHIHNVDYNWAIDFGVYGWGAMINEYDSDYVFKSDSIHKYMSPTGGDKSHNNIQPYVVTYFWMRVS